MQLLVADTRRRSTVGGDVLPQAVAASDAQASHALVLGAPVAVCGTPAAARPGRLAWPAGGPRCPACESLVATFTG
jgi:hypothetical protein